MLVQYRQYDHDAGNISMPQVTLPQYRQLACCNAGNCCLALILILWVIRQQMFDDAVTHYEGEKESLIAVAHFPQGIDLASQIGPMRGRSGRNRSI